MLKPLAYFFVPSLLTALPAYGLYWFLSLTGCRGKIDLAFRIASLLLFLMLSAGLSDGSRTMCKTYGQYAGMQFGRVLAVAVFIGLFTHDRW